MPGNFHRYISESRYTQGILEQRIGKLINYNKLTKEHRNTIYKVEYSFYIYNFKK